MKLEKTLEKTIARVATATLTCSARWKRTAGRYAASITYPRAVRIIHWSLALLIHAHVSLITVVMRLKSIEVVRMIAAVQVQIDLLVLMIVLLRLVLWLRHRSPQLQAPRQRIRIAQMTYVVIFLALGAQSILGIAASWSRGDEIRILGLVKIPAFIPLTTEQGVAIEAGHIWLTFSLVTILGVWLGRLLFNHFVRIRRGLPEMVPHPGRKDRLVNRVPVITQLCLCFGTILTLTTAASSYGAYQFRTASAVREQFDENDSAALDEMQLTAVALRAALTAQRNPDGDRAAMTQLEATLERFGARLPNATRGGIEDALGALRSRIGGDRSADTAAVAKSRLDSAIARQTETVFQKKQMIKEKAAFGQDTMLLTAGLTFNISILAAFLLSRSILMALAKARTLIKSIEGNTQAEELEVYGNGEFAVLMRNMVQMRDAVAARQDESHKLQAEISRRAVEREADIMGRSAEEQAQVVKQLAGGLAELASGHLGYRINEQFPGNYDRIREDFNQAMARRELAMETISRSSDAIGNSSQEVAQEASNLAARSKLQSSTLSDMASTLDRMTVEVEAAADGALRGAEAVSSVRTAAEESGKIVGEAIQAMDDIEKSSARIVEIIDVIDTFATRSNLLALNARIEAARAGESGRGFAVVAQEVHGLARRAGVAASDIRTLIAESSRHVGTGVTLVQETDRALQQIVVKTEQVDALVARVASSARDQAVRLTGLNSEMRRLDSIAQENEAMVGEATEALQTIKSNAAALDGLIKGQVPADEDHDAGAVSEVIQLREKRA